MSYPIKTVANGAVLDLMKSGSDSVDIGMDRAVAPEVNRLEAVERMRIRAATSPTHDTTGCLD